jgi:predicted nucleic acid-binding protein
VDTSALVKLYFTEDESGTINELLRGRRDVVISQLALTEMVSALSRRRREGTLSVDIATKAHRAVLNHVYSGVYRCVDLFPETHREAERILLFSMPLRAADALHVALALSAKAAGLVTFDTQMGEAARSLGLVAIPR